VKLPDSREQALSMTGTEPTGYGLGRAGWISARYGPGEDVPVDILCDWIEESYRAVAPKKLVVELDSRAGG
jgi:predicted DNA-binding protein (MmcQ/YjbR family)